MNIDIRDTGYEIDLDQKGQVIIILLLVMLVSLSVGLALTQRSVNDVTTSTQVEQATRAFSAAEAGIQKALSSPLPLGYILPLDNNSSATVDSSGLLPYSGTNAGIEYPKIGRETTAQFWFVDPSVVGAPVAFYNPGSASFDLYYGNALTTDLPAVDVTVVIQSGSNFYTYSQYYDSHTTRADPPSGNGFTETSCTNPTMATGILGNSRQFYCRQTVGPILDLGTVAPSDSCGTATCKLILARIRFLYIKENHSLAIAPVVGSQFPPQVQIYNATGTAGQSQKQVQAFKVKDVVLPWFDFALFSTNEIIK